jgi:predicted DCC family thiol-disulfide oxidoreductase YuxK
MKEMLHLSKLDSQKKIGFVDIHNAVEMKRYTDINQTLANTILHGKLPSGEVIFGLDVTHKAWQLVGKGYLTLLIRLPVIGYFADKVYLMFARQRYRISLYLTGKPRCDANCELIDQKAYVAVFERSIK